MTGRVPTPQSLPRPVPDLRPCSDTPGQPANDAAHAGNSDGAVAGACSAGGGYLAHFDASFLGPADPAARKSPDPWDAIGAGSDFGARTWTGGPHSALGHATGRPD